MRKRNKNVSLRLTDQEHKELEKGAKKENRTITNFIVWLILQFNKKEQ